MTDEFFVGRGGGEGRLRSDNVYINILTHLLAVLYH